MAISKPLETIWIENWIMIDESRLKTKNGNLIKCDCETPHWFELGNGEIQCWGCGRYARN